MTTTLDHSTDEDLVLSFQGGDEVALHELLRRFRPHIRQVTRRLFISGGDVDDVVQEGMIGLYRAIVGFEPGRGSFHAFATHCATRQVYSAIQRARRMKHAPLQTAERFDEVPDRVPELVDEGVDPERVTIARIELDELRRWCVAGLTDLERRVLEGYANGESYEAIARRLGEGIKTVDNALQRVKRKLEVYLDGRSLEAAAA